MSEASQSTTTDAGIDNAVSALEAPSPADRMLKLFSVHFVLGIGALAMWAAADAWQQVTQLPAAAFLSVSAAIVAGVVVPTLIHEWFHYLGAKFSGATYTIPDKLVLFVFNFDFKKNSLQQFMTMSWAGQAGSWVAIVLLWLAVPMDTAGRSMLVCAAVGSAVFAGTIEWPVIMRARASGNPLLELSRLNRAGINRCGGMGIAAALLLWLIAA